MADVKLSPAHERIFRAVAAGQVRVDHHRRDLGYDQYYLLGEEDVTRPTRALLRKGLIWHPTPHAAPAPTPAGESWIAAHPKEPR